MVAEDIALEKKLIEAAPFKTESERIQIRVGNTTQVLNIGFFFSAKKITKTPIFDISPTCWSEYHTGWGSPTRSWEYTNELGAIYTKISKKS